MTTAAVTRPIILALLLGLFSPAFANETYDRAIKLLIDAGTTKAATAGLRDLIWQLEEKERCVLRQDYSEQSPLSGNIRLVRQTIIPLGAIDPSKVERHGNSTIVIVSKQREGAFQVVQVDPAGPTETVGLFYLQLKYDADSLAVADAVRALAEICK